MINRNWKFALLVFPISALLGCSSVVANHCREIDWHAEGREDGVNGQDRKRFLADAKTCAAEGGRVDRAAYERGRAEGVRIFCSYENGYRLAWEGKGFRGTCPRDLTAGFKRGFADGKQRLSVHQGSESAMPATQIE